jgi:hypothetical protein
LGALPKSEKDKENVTWAEEENFVSNLENQEKTKINEHLRHWQLDD